MAYQRLSTARCIDIACRIRHRKGKRLAVWQSGIGGLGWIYTLINKNKAIELGGCGYPSRYTAQAKHILPELAGEPPEANAVWSCGPTDQLSEAWSSKTAKDQELMQGCLPDEWLIIDAWDES